eukprot:CAMPEP_0183795172 /NCGR_PEP_ID=MMETSP0803_2-20130417/4271_1 /TAXON_ID=195967 /ORGANISM="Crustomastix stigmata, Strain CCMP3273" /LENGTH=100 /DNA_ID=CAMNT_0026039583 /DNA_START=114 /DNA_END=416 /DNA_ORIENTATION=+
MSHLPSCLSNTFVASGGWCSLPSITSSPLTHAIPTAACTDASLIATAACLPPPAPKMSCQLAMIVSKPMSSGPPGCTHLAWRLLHHTAAMSRALPLEKAA